MLFFQLLIAFVLWRFGACLGAVNGGERPAVSPTLSMKFDAESTARCDRQDAHHKSSDVSQQNEQHGGPQHVHENVDTVAISAANTLCHEG